MRLHHLLFVSASVSLSLACGSGGSEPLAPAQACDLVTVGPLIGYSYQTMAQPAATGGKIADGVYDLTQIVEHDKASGAWSSNNAPAFRWSIRFTAQERSPNHAEGLVTSAIDLPPAHACDPGRFATVDTDLRMLTKAHPELNVERYAVTPDWLMLLSKGETYVFRQRR